MLDLYRGLSRYDGSLCATFALSDAVKSGFNTNDPDYRHAEVSMVPEYLLVDLSLLDDVLEDDAALMIYELGIIIDDTVRRVIKQAASDISKRKGGIENLPVSSWRNTIRMKGPLCP